jgi:hypothetical protein
MPAAKALDDLIVAVANLEWSPLTASASEVARIRVALEGVRKALTDYADAVGSAGNGARPTRLGESLAPVLRDLVLQVLPTESVQPSASGQEAFEAARQRAAGLLADWVQHVQANGVSSQPPFAKSGVHDVFPYADEDDVAEIREALLYRPIQEMWQLCAPADLGALNAAVVPEVVRFASRLNRDALAGTVPGDQPVWTSSGSYAGILRLVPLRSGLVSTSWSESSATEPS